MIAVLTFDIFTLFLQLMEACFLFNNCSMSGQQIITWKLLIIALLFVSVIYVAKSLPFLFNTIFTSYFADKSNVPKVLTNSKGKKRVPGSRDLGQAVKTSDDKFLDFIKRCLE